MACFACKDAALEHIALPGVPRSPSPAQGPRTPGMPRMARPLIVAPRRSLDSGLRKSSRNRSSALVIALAMSMCRQEEFSWTD